MSERSEVSGPDSIRQRIWDLPTRLFHWTLVALIATLWWSGEQRTLDWHRLAGYAVIVLLLFRLAWGFAGSSTARFRSFVRSPRAVAGYVRRDLFNRAAARHHGHNPLGGWSVIAMLALLSGQVALGMFAVDVDGIESGPFSYLVDFDTGRLAARLHHQAFNLLLGLMAFHLVAVLFYLLHRRHNLIAPMVTGTVRSSKGSELSFASHRLAAFLLTLCAGLTWAVVRLLGQA